MTVIQNINKNAHIVDDIDSETRYVGVICLYQGVYELTPFLFNVDEYDPYLPDIYDVIDHVLEYCERNHFSSFYCTRDELDEEELKHAAEFSEGRYLDEESLFNVSDVYRFDLTNNDDCSELYRRYGFYLV